MFAAVQGVLTRGNPVPYLNLVTSAVVVGGHPVLDLTLLTPSTEDAYNAAVGDDESELLRNTLILNLEELLLHIESAPSVWRAPINESITAIHAARTSEEADAEPELIGVNPSLRYAALCISGPDPLILIACSTGTEISLLRAPVGDLANRLLHAGVAALLLSIYTKLTKTSL
jgi:hypothetical protein